MCTLQGVRYTLAAARGQEVTHLMERCKSLRKGCRLKMDPCSVCGMYIYKHSSKSMYFLLSSIMQLAVWFITYISDCMEVT